MIIFVSVLFWSGIHPKDQVTWLLEVSPAIIGALMIALTYATFRLTPSDIPDNTSFCRDVSSIGHYGTGDVEFTVSSESEFNNIKHFITLAYNKVGGMNSKPP